MCLKSGDPFNTPQRIFCYICKAILVISSILTLRVTGVFLLGSNTVSGSTSLSVRVATVVGQRLPLCLWVWSSSIVMNDGLFRGRDRYSSGSGGRTRAFSLTRDEILQTLSFASGREGLFHLALKPAVIGVGCTLLFDCKPIFGEWVSRIRLWLEMGLSS